jgi:ankyrin repeat protein
MNANVTDGIGKIALHLAAERGDDDIVKTLVGGSGVDVGFKNPDGRTALHLSSEKGHVNVVKALISDLGADVNSKDINGQTPLHLAAKMGHTNVLRVLIGEDAGKSPRGTTPPRRSGL